MNMKRLLNFLIKRIDRKRKRFTLTRSIVCVGNKSRNMPLLGIFYSETVTMRSQTKISLD